MKNTLLILALIAPLSSIATAQTPGAEKAQTPDPLSVGSSTRAWLVEQRSDTNRAPVEPYPAQRAAQSVVKYVSGADAGSQSATSSSFKATSNATGSTR
ncbi:MAG: hypothetical protein LW629_07725 [Burkholderiales bacterium]|nr:hypothetical protein [Burkholderiales bacterium]